MTVNKNHPDYPIYSAKHKALWDAYMELWNQEDEKYPGLCGLDSPASEVLRPAFRKLSKDIKALQQKYSHLFTEEVS